MCVVPPGTGHVQFGPGDEVVANAGRLRYRVSGSGVGTLRRRTSCGQPQVAAILPAALAPRPRRVYDDARVGELVR